MVLTRSACVNLCWEEQVAVWNRATLSRLLAVARNTASTLHSPVLRWEDWRC